MNEMSPLPITAKRKPKRIRGSEQTRQRILAAAKTVLASEGVQKATIRKIAKQAGVSGGLINQYFGSKVELIHEIFRLGNRPLSEYFRTHIDQFSTPQEMVLGAMSEYLRRDLKDPELSRQIMASSWSWSAEDETRFATSLGELTDIVAAALQERFYPGQVFLTQTATYTLVSTFVGVLRMGLQKGWEYQTYVNVMKPSFEMILVGLDHQINRSIKQETGR